MLRMLLAFYGFRFGDFLQPQFAYIPLGNCFCFFDIRPTRVLKNYFNYGSKGSIVAMSKHAGSVYLLSLALEVMGHPEERAIFIHGLGFQGLGFRGFARGLSADQISGRDMRISETVFFLRNEGHLIGVLLACYSGIDIRRGSCYLGIKLEGTPFFVNPHVVIIVEGFEVSGFRVQGK